MKTSCKSVSRLVLVAGFILAFSPCLRAIDPLPAELENAPLELQAAYRDKVARESEAQKLQVGRERHAQKMAFKQALSDNIQTEAAARRAIYLEQVRAQEQVPATSQNGSRFGVFAAIALVIFIAVWVRYRHRTGELDRA